MTDFNGIFVDPAELAGPRLQAAAHELATLRERFAAMRLPLRVDHFRDWEHARVVSEVDRIASGTPLRILDVGGGNAAPAWCLAARGHRVTVLDTDPNVIATIQRTSRMISRSGQISATQPRDRVWPFADGAFDLTLCVSVIEGLLTADRAPFFSELRRTLAPGGTLLITFDYGHDARFVGDPPTTVAEIEQQIVAPSGLELVGDLPPSPDFGQRPPPVTDVAIAADGSQRPIAYTFGALRLRRPD